MIPDEIILYIIKYILNIKCIINNDDMNVLFINKFYYKNIKYYFMNCKLLKVNCLYGNYLDMCKYHQRLEIECIEVILQKYKSIIFSQQKYEFIHSKSLDIFKYYLPFYNLQMVDTCCGGSGIKISLIKDL